MIDASKVICTIAGAVILGNQRAQGFCKGGAGKGDGTPIRTSPIVEGPDEQGLIRTRSGSVYRLELITSVRDPIVEES